MLCDTNIISELARPHPNQGVWTWASQHPHIYLSAITIEELYFGLAWKSNPRIKLWLDHFIKDYCSILEITSEIAQFAGELRGNLQLKGITRTQADILIAATAAIHGLTLVTRNERDFESCGITILNPFKL